MRQDVSRLSTVPEKPAEDPLVSIDSALMQTEDLGLVSLCKGLCELPFAPEESLVGQAQRLFQMGRIHDAANCIGQFLIENSLELDEDQEIVVDGKRLKFHRKLKNYTQASLAKALGCQSPHISHVETGKNGLSLRRFVLMLATLGVQAKALYRVDDDLIKQRQHKRSVTPLLGK